MFFSSAKIQIKNQKSNFFHDEPGQRNYTATEADTIPHAKTPRREVFIWASAFGFAPR